MSELTETSGTPGQEERVRDVVRDHLPDDLDAVRTDAMGNLVATTSDSTWPTVCIGNSR